MRGLFAIPKKHGYQKLIQLNFQFTRFWSLTYYHWASNELIRKIPYAIIAYGISSLSVHTFLLWHNSTIEPIAKNRMPKAIM